MNLTEISEKMHNVRRQLNRHPMSDEPVCEDLALRDAVTALVEVVDGLVDHVQALERTAKRLEHLAMEHDNR